MPLLLLLLQVAAVVWPWTRLLQLPQLPQPELPADEDDRVNGCTAAEQQEMLHSYARAAALATIGVMRQRLEDSSPAERQYVKVGAP
jgi:hypothetical protein